MTEKLGGIVQESILDYNFNSEFARSLSVDLTKYENDISKNYDNVENIFKSDDFSMSEISNSPENVNKSDEDKQKQLWNKTRENQHQV